MILNASVYVLCLCPSTWSTEQRIKRKKTRAHFKRDKLSCASRFEEDVNGHRHQKRESRQSLEVAEPKGDSCEAKRIWIQTWWGLQTQTYLRTCLSHVWLGQFFFLRSVRIICYSIIKLLIISFGSRRRMILLVLLKYSNDVIFFLKETFSSLIPAVDSEIV